jgi:hypothetical protein
MVAGMIETLAQRTVNEERKRRDQGRYQVFQSLLCQRSRRKDYCSRRQVRVAVLKEVGNRGELGKPTPDSHDDGTGSPQSRPEAEAPTPPCPVDQSSPAAEPYCLLGTPWIDD